MQSKISTTQLELFNESALPEAVTLHADRPGFFSLLVKPVATTPRQTSYRVSLLPQVLAALDPDIDSYMSQATFFRPNRRLVNLWHLPLCFVDLDTYKTAYGKLHEEPLSLAVRQRLADVGIPPGSRCHQAALIRLRCLRVYDQAKVHSPRHTRGLSPRVRGNPGSRRAYLADEGSFREEKD